MTHRTPAIAMVIALVAASFAVRAEEDKVALKNPDELKKMLPEKAEGFKLDKPQTLRYGAGDEAVSMVTLTGADKETDRSLSLMINDTGMGSRWEAIQQMQDMTLETDEMSMKSVKIEGVGAMQVIDKNAETVTFSIPVNGYLVTATMEGTKDPKPLTTILESMDWKALKAQRK